MQFGASTFIWVSPFSNKTLGLVKKVREMGFDIIEICVEDPSTIDPARIKEALEENGIGATVCGAFGPDRDAQSSNQFQQELFMQRLKFLGNRQSVIEQVPIPTASGDDVVIEMKATALCGTDLHSLYRNSEESPCTPGHEFAGVVVETGEKSTYKKGDRVAV